MSGPPNLCKECKGKFGLGNYCEVCENFLRLDFYLKSPRCPGVISPFVATKLREVHRLILEEAERYWASQPLDPEPVATTPKSGPPLAPGGSGKGAGKDKGVPEAPEGTPEVRVKEEVDEFEEVPVEEPRHPRRSDRGSEEKHKRKRRKHRGSESSEERVRRKKKEVVDHSSRKKTRERSPAKEELKRRRASSPTSDLPRSGERASPSPRGARSAPSSASRRPKTPSFSPPRQKWEGPIPAFKPKSKYWGKNKGKRKREAQVAWKKTWEGKRR